MPHENRPAGGMKRGIGGGDRIADGDGLMGWGSQMELEGGRRRLAGLFTAWPDPGAVQLQREPSRRPTRPWTRGLQRPSRAAGSVHPPMDPTAVPCPPGRFHWLQVGRSTASTAESCHEATSPSHWTRASRSWQRSPVDPPAVPLRANPPDAPAACARLPDRWPSALQGRCTNTNEVPVRQRHAVPDTQAQAPRDMPVGRPRHAPHRRVRTDAKMPRPCILVPSVVRCRQGETRTVPRRSPRRHRLHH